MPHIVYKLVGHFLSTYISNSNQMFFSKFIEYLFKKTLRNSMVKSQVVIYFSNSLLDFYQFISSYINLLRL